MRQRFSTRTRLVSGLLTAAMVFTFLPFSALAAEEGVAIDDTNFPDAAFREYLKEFDQDKSGNLSQTERYAVTQIKVTGGYNGQKIQDLTGIQFFPNLQLLSCGENQLTKLDMSQNPALEELYGYENQLTSLDVSQNAKLKILRCNKNQLTSLNVSQNPALRKLDCYRNKLTELDVSQNPALKELNCYENQLTELDLRQNPELQVLRCYENQLTELDLSQNPEMLQLRCCKNQLERLDVSRNIKLQDMNCSQNDLTSLDVSQMGDLEFLNCSNNRLAELDLRQSPKMIELHCNDNFLESLDLSPDARPDKLYCDNNQLSSLNLEKEPTIFHASGNAYSIAIHWDRKTFDPSALPGNFDMSRAKDWTGVIENGTDTLQVVSGAPMLTYKYRCYGNYYEPFTLNVTWTYDDTPSDGVALNAENFPDEAFRTYLQTQFDTDGNGYLRNAERNAVTEIVADNKGMTSLKGVEHFPNLKKLSCTGNQLTQLDLSQNTALEELHCNGNQLPELDLSSNTALVYLRCNKNPLTKLNVSQSVQLKELDVSDCQLPQLDVSRNTALTALQCSGNALTELDVRSNAALVYLMCNRNQLTQLDVSQNAALAQLLCEENQLTDLDLSHNPAFRSLSCQQNQLTKLDVSQNPKLEYLHCAKNQLTTLDLSKNPYLKKLVCEGNQLTSLNVANTQIKDGSGAANGLMPDGNQYSIAIDRTARTFDLSNLPAGFDRNKTSGWTGGTVEGNTLKVDEGATEVTYTYDCGNGCSRSFTLNVTETGTTTPPSGGGTGTTTPPSGGGTGTTTPPSGGGTGTTTPPSGGGTGTTTPPSGGGTGTTTPPSGGDGTGTTTPPSGGGTGTTTPPSGGGGGGAAILLVGGAAVAGLVGYGVYNYVSEQQLKALLPEGTAVPENRAQTALLLWNTAGRPEPAAAPAFADVADPDTAKAAQWCVEQNLLQTRRDGAFAPDSSLPVYKTLNVYRQLTGK